MIALVGFSPHLFGGTLYITDFGATPNDDKDDLPAIKQAISYAQKGDTIYIPKGTWICKGTIALTKSVSLLGAGIDKSVLRPTPNRASSAIEIVNVQHTKISHFTIDAINSKNCSQGIEASDSSRLHIHDIKVANLIENDSFGPHGIYFSSNVTDSIIEKCLITHIGINTKWGAGIRNHKGCHRNTIKGNLITHTGRGGILCAGSTHLTIQKNQVSNSGVTTGEGLGIELFDRCDHSLVEDNRLDHWLSVDTSHLVAVRRNQVIGKESSMIKWAGLELADSTNCVFTNNTVDGGAQVGISISNSEPKKYVYWAHNKIHRCSMWGAQVQGQEGGARYLYFYANTFSESQANHPKAIYKNTGQGFRINDHTHSVTLESNRIINNQSAGLQILGDSVTELNFVNNEIVGNLGPVVELDDKSITLGWQKNTVKTNALNQINSPIAPVAPPLQIVIDTPDVAKVGENITFKCLTLGGSQPNITHFLWDFGAGLPSNQSLPTISYTTPGNYQVTLLIWNQKGQASRIAKPITIVPRGL